MTREELKEQYDMAVAFGYEKDARFVRRYNEFKKRVK